MKETLVWGCKIGEADAMEEILYRCEGIADHGKLMEFVGDWARRNNYDRLRVAEIDLSTPADFAGAVNKM